MIQGINQFNYTILLNILITYEHIDQVIYITKNKSIYEDKH